VCGIAGFVGAGDRADLDAMIDVLRHRGPDALTTWSDGGNVFIAHTRLAIIDLQDGGQPMQTVDGDLVITYNGEIYNHQELRRELEGLGHTFATDHADTEVLLHGYRQWGHEVPEHLNGMWAFAVLDRSRGELFLSRDRFGEKPLYYTRQQGTFAFASELHALTRHRLVETSLSPLAVRKYFAYGYIPAPNSLYHEIHKLDKGHNLVLRVDDLQYSLQRYWRFLIEPEEPSHSEEELCQELRDLLRKAVKRRLMSDVPLAIFLSGGIDSSSVAAFAVQASSADQVKSFSIAFSDASFDESEYAREVAERLGIEHHVAVLSMEEASALLPEISRRLDEPIGDSSLLPTFLLCREARKRITVALGGDGGDELFAGYDPFRALALARAYSAIVPRPVHQGIRLAISLLPTSHRNMSLDFRIKRTLRGLSYPPAIWNPVWMGPLDPVELQEVLGEPVDTEELYAEAIAEWDACREGTLVDRTLQFFTNLYLGDDILVKTDRASMMNSLEVRAPYLDVDLVERVRRLPSHLKYRRGTTKYILKKALRPILPHRVLYRSKKGFGAPIGRWFQEGKLSLSRAPAFFDGLTFHRFLTRRLHEPRQGKQDHRLFLWSLWLLQQGRVGETQTDRTAAHS
jgi:asparagine synthase (glutamine-hydrolysing)